MVIVSYRCYTEQMDECRRLHGMEQKLALAVIAHFIGLAIYAAHRRTELRERFNIVGAQPSCSAGVEFGMYAAVCLCLPTHD